MNTWPRAGGSWYGHVRYPYVLRSTCIMHKTRLFLTTNLYNIRQVN